MSVNVEQAKETLKNNGFTSVEVYVAEPMEEDIDHTHEFDTYICILTGTMCVRMNGTERILTNGEEISIPRAVVHYSKVGDTGCTYLYAEKH